MIDRRAVLAGAAASGACSSRRAASAGGVLAAGQPAALLIWCLAPGRLIGWPRKPSPDALALLPPGAAALRETGALSGGGSPLGLEAAAALQPALILDYGDTDAGDQALAGRVRERVGVPYRLIDGDLTAIPAAFEKAGALLGAPERGRALADRTEALISQWARARRTGPRFYYARGRDGLETAFEGALATEVLERDGWRNVAVDGRDIGRVSREQVVAWDPEIVVTLDRGFAAAAADDPVWRRRADGTRRTLLIAPDLPFGWIDRPPSVNRLLGVAWRAGPLDRDGLPTAAGLDRIGALMGELYGVTPDVTALRALAPRIVP